MDVDVAVMNLLNARLIVCLLVCICKGFHSVFEECVPIMC